MFVFEEETVPLKPDIWKLDDALALVREIRPKAHNVGWHFAMGGGVLNRGSSKKDLDLYLMKFDNDPRSKDPVEFLTGMFGPGKPINDPTYEGPATESNYREKLQFTDRGRRIDVFVL